MDAEFSIEKARRIQKCLAKKVINEDRLPTEIKLIAGVDAAYWTDRVFGAAAVLHYESLGVLESQTATQKAKFPYFPTLLSFRELPVIVACIRKLTLQPDVFLVDGHGRAHPYRFGLASHLGLALGRPTIGVAKNRLVGEPKQFGDNIFLIENDEIIGAVVSTRTGTKPIYVSVGHMVSLETAIKIVKHCAQNSRIPQPIWQAHRLSTEKRKTEIAADTHSG